MDLKGVIDKVIREIQEQQSRKMTEITDNAKLVQDIGFSSLDIAQLVASLEIETGLDPFAEGVSINKISTVGELFQVYHNSFINAGKNLKQDDGNESNE